MKRYLLHVFIGFDQLITTLLGGWPDETLSSYAYRLHRQNKPWGRIWMPIIDWLFSWQGPGHCRRAYQEDMLRVQFPREMR